MAGLMNSFYYGKAGKADYTPDQLPANRVALFFEMLRVRFSGLISVNLIYLLFCIPAIAWTYINYLTSLAIAEGTVSVDYRSLISQYLIGMVPCLLISGLGASGTTYILRNWARDQHSFIWSDFKDSLKSNWKNGLIVGLLNGLSLVITYICHQYYGAMAAQSLFFVIPQSIVVVCCAVWWMINMLIYPMMITYDMKFSMLLKNSLIMVLARLPWSILFWAGSVAVPGILLFVVPPYGMLVAILLYLLVGFSLTGFVYVSYANSCFDRFLNPRIEGAPVNMGLRDPIYDEEDDEEDESK